MEETEKELPTTNPYPVPECKPICRQDAKYLYCNDRPNSMIMILADCDGGDMVARKAIADYVMSVGGRDVRCKGQFGTWESFMQRTREMNVKEWELAYNNQRLGTQLHSNFWDFAHDSKSSEWVKMKRDMWDRIWALEEFFERYPIHSIEGDPIELAKGETIVDIRNFLDTNLKTLRSSKGYTLICTVERLERLRSKLDADSFNSNNSQNPHKKSAKNEESSKKSEKTLQVDRSREKSLHETQAGIRLSLIHI